VVRLASAGVFCLIEPQHPFSQGVKDLGSQIMALE
jgi:hypothetical protein